jgi:hypothetical protein
MHHARTGGMTIPGHMGSSAQRPPLLLRLWVQMDTSNTTGGSGRLCGAAEVGVTGCDGV